VPAVVLRVLSPDSFLLLRLILVAVHFECAFVSVTTWRLKETFFDARPLGGDCCFLVGTMSLCLSLGCSRHRWQRLISSTNSLSTSIISRSFFLFFWRGERYG